MKTLDPNEAEAQELLQHAALGGPEGPFICGQCMSPLFGIPTDDVQHDHYLVHCFDYVCPKCGPCVSDQQAMRFHPAGHGHSGWCFCPVGEPCKFCGAVRDD